MAVFNVNFCDPLKPDVTPLGTFSKEDVVQLFLKIDWNTWLAKRNTAPEEEIYYSPAIQVENPTDKAALEISVTGGTGNYSFYVLYFTPQVSKKILGITVSSSGGDLKDLGIKNAVEAKALLDALLDGNYHHLQ